MSKEMEALEKIGDKSTYHMIIGENGFYERESDMQDINELPEYELIRTALLQGESDAKELAEIRARGEEQRKKHEGDYDWYGSRNPAIVLIDYILKGEKV